MERRIVLVDDIFNIYVGNVDILDKKLTRNKIENISLTQLLNLPEQTQPENKKINRDKRIYLSDFVLFVLYSELDSLYFKTNGKELLIPTEHILFGHDISTDAFKCDKDFKSEVKNAVLERKKFGFQNLLISGDVLAFNKQYLNNQFLSVTNVEIEGNITKFLNQSDLDNKSKFCALNKKHIRYFQ